MALVMQLCHTIFEHLCCKVVANLHVHFEDVLKRNGGHLTYTVH